MADINKEASWVTARLMEVSNATQDGTNILITNANIQNFTPSDVVRTSAQTLTDAEQAQVRTNIGAAAQSDITELSADITDLSNDKMDKLPEGSVAGNIPLIDNNHNISDSGKSLSDLYDAAMISKTASGSIVTITDGADGVPIKEMTVQIAPVQAGSGDPSSSNVRAISGWTAMKIARTPANLLCKDAIAEGYYINNSTGALVTYSSWFASDWIKVTAGKQYRARVGGSGTYDNITNGNCYYAFYDSNRTYISGGTTAQMNAPTNAVWLRMSTPKTMLETLIVVEVPYASIYTALADYTEGNTYTIEFPTSAGTVYGGSLTVHEDGTGTLTVNRFEYAFTGTEGFVKRSDGTYYQNVNTRYPYAISQRPESGICSHFKYGAFNYGDSVVCNGLNGNTGRYTVFYAPRVDALLSISTAAEFNAYLASQYANGTPVQICYLLASPITYDLTADQVRTLLFSTLKGLNNIWADTGDISITYRADPTLATAEQAQAIKESIAYYQTDYTAKRAYVVNDLVYVGDVLYIVTSAIAQGATMTPNTNCSQTTLNAVIKSLR